VGWLANRHATKLAKASGQLRRSNVQLAVFGQDLQEEVGSSWYFVTNDPEVEDALIELPIVITNMGDAKTEDMVLTVQGSKLCLLDDLKGEGISVIPEVLRASSNLGVSHIGGMSQYSVTVPSIPPMTAARVFLPIVIPTDSSTSGVVDVETADREKVQLSYNYDLVFPFTFGVFLQDSPAIQSSINISSVIAANIFKGMDVIEKKYRAEWRKWSKTKNWARVTLARFSSMQAKINVRFVELCSPDNHLSKDGKRVAYMMSQPGTTTRSAKIRIRVPPK
jgi:hypothetical protein